MNKLQLPYHLIIPPVVCLLALGIIIFKRKKIVAKDRDQLFWVSLILFLAIYAVIVGYAAVMDVYYQVHLNSFDLNKDGVFGGAELSKEQEEALKHVTADVERNYSLLSGLIYAVIVSVPLWLIGTSFKKQREEKKKR